MSKSIKNKVEEIRINFINSLPERLKKIETLVEVLISENPNISRKNELLHELHHLYGVSSGYGLDRVKEMAGLTQELVKAMYHGQRALSIEDKAKLQSTINALASQIHSIDQRHNNEILILDANIHHVTQNSPLILVVDDDSDFCETISLQLEHLGYRVKCINSTDRLAHDIKLHKPEAIFISITLNDDPDAGLTIVAQLNETLENVAPIIYLSSNDDINTRLKAVRNDGVAFLSKDFNLGDLKNILDIIVPLKKSSCKVLIIDDDQVSAEFCQTILEHAAIKVRILSNPEDVFEYINNFDPDLILLDVHMPEVNGFELASVIRQNVLFSSIPIIIISSDIEIGKQIEMQYSGADGLILKPFKPHHLVNIILNRIQRSRQTERMIYTDGLTGLIMYPKIKDQLAILLESCLRYNLEFTVALLDLDKFKLINDQYGHIVGDQVLRSFGQLLLNRLRRSDIVTRYGGDEFAIIFPYTSITQAEIAINNIRESLDKQSQHCTKGEFKFTFSAGLASIHNHKEFSELINAADQALYKAKDTGRNQTC